MPKKDTKAAKKAATTKKIVATKKTIGTSSKKMTIGIFSNEPNEVGDSLIMCPSKLEERSLTRVQTNDEALKKKKPNHKDSAIETFSDEPGEGSGSLICLSNRDERRLTKVQDRKSVV